LICKVTDHEADQRQDNEPWRDPSMGAQRACSEIASAHESDFMIPDSDGQLANSYCARFQIVPPATPDVTARQMPPPDQSSHEASKFSFEGEVKGADRVSEALVPSLTEVSGEPAAWPKIDARRAIAKTIPGVNVIADCVERLQFASHVT
jgi:hypothetical protein